MAASVGYYIATDPDQEKQGFYKVSKTANISTTMTQLNVSRALKDFKLVKFFQCADIKKAEEFIKSALKKKYITGSVEWIKVDDVAALNKIQSTIETLVDIVNNAED